MPLLTEKIEAFEWTKGGFTEKLKEKFSSLFRKRF